MNCPGPPPSPGHDALSTGGHGWATLTRETADRERWGKCLTLGPRPFSPAQFKLGSPANGGLFSHGISRDRTLGDWVAEVWRHQLVFQPDQHARLDALPGDGLQVPLARRVAQL
jgi:hypothetical protein